MSRIGKQPIAIPAGVKVSVNGCDVTVENSGKKLAITHRPEVTVKVEDDQVIVERGGDDKPSKSFHGLTRSLIANMITGVTTGFTRELEIVGVGWNAQVTGKTIGLKVGYADTKVVEIPMGVDVQVQGPKITVSGTDKQAVGQTAAKIRDQRKPEPYNGKGIKYSDEVILRKQGKAFGS